MALNFTNTLRSLLGNKPKSGEEAATPEVVPSRPETAKPAAASINPAPAPALPPEPAGLEKPASETEFYRRVFGNPQKSETPPAETPFTGELPPPVPEGDNTVVFTKNANATNTGENTMVFSRPTSAASSNAFDARSKYLAAAVKGDPNAQFKLGLAYATGQGVPQNYAEAAVWFQKAAEQGDAMVQYQVGIFYEKGRGVAQDFSQAAEWFRRAAEQGLPNAACKLAVLLEQGLGVAQDHAAAFKYYKVGAGRDLPEAQFRMGSMFLEGLGTTRDPVQAQHWLEKAAAGKHVEAMFKLGYAFKNCAFGPQKKK